MSGFSVDRFVPAVVALIRFSPTMDVLLLAARALAAILEHFPATAVPKAVAEGVVPSLCDKLLEIEYMDVAELALQILERVVCKPEALASPAAAAEYRHAVVRENGFVALLQFVDFFPIEIQRSAARIVCQLCTNFPAALARELREGFGLLANLLQAFDAEIVQSACDAMRKLAESKSFTESSVISALVASDAVCDAMAKLLAAYGAESEASGSSGPQLPPPGYTSILKFMACVLSSAAVSSTELVWRLRFVTLPPIVTALLANETAMEDNQLLRDTLKLVIVLLPIPDELSGMATVPEQVVALAHEILPSIIRVYDATSRSDLRYECLGVIYRGCSIIYAREEVFTSREHTELSRLAAFLARVLRPRGANHSGGGDERDLLPVHLALQIVESSLDHAKSARAAVLELFERHGVATAIRFYASSGDRGEGEEAEKTAKPQDTYEVVASSTRLVGDYLGTHSAATSLVVQLQGVVAELQTVLADKEDKDGDLERDIRTVLHKLQSVVLRGDELVTAHEIACSGLVKTLTRVLSRSDGKQAFRRVFLDEDDRGRQNDQFVACLVQCIQDAIASEKDAFSTEYLGSHAGSAHGSSSVSNDLEQLTQHVKVRVVIEDDGSDDKSGGDASSDTQQQQAEDEQRRPGSWFKKHGLRRSASGSARLDPNHLYKRNKKSVHDTVVLVEPLARIETMEEFISDKLFGSRGSTSILDELTGRSHADDDESEQKEGEDGRGEDDVKEKTIQALYKGTKLPADMSILEAIVKFGGAATDSSGESKKAPVAAGAHDIELTRIWSSAPHEITFRVLPPSSQSDSKSSPDAGSSTDTSDEADRECGGASSEVQATSSSTPQCSQLAHQWWDDVWELLSLLKLVHELVGSQQQQETGAIVFTNTFLCLQVNRVLQQPVRVVTHALPSWCFRLLTDFAFVLDYDTRYHFTYAISCGSSRAIQYLCRSVWKRAVLDEPVAAVRGAHASTSSNGSRRRGTGAPRDSGGSRSRTAALVNISRMVKLPRLKVRVARSRLLQSAMKLLAIYGGKKAVIEIEFLGEVGTGLGPTTEFFTLICQEIQAKQLQMWRDDDSNKQVPQRLSDAKSETTDEAEEAKAAEAAQAALPIRGYHRVAVYHCVACSRVRFPHCAVHNQLLTHEKRRESNQQRNGEDDSNNNNVDAAAAAGSSSSSSVPQCAECLDARDWHSEMATCDCDGSGERVASGESDGSGAAPALKWWILSDEEVQYLSKVYPRRAASVKHPVLQCAHCDTVNFPGTDAGIVTMDGERLVSRSGRRMYERDYRAVTKHVSPLCEGTPLTTLPSLLTRVDVELLVALTARSPEVLESDIESLTYLQETSQFSDGGPAVVAPHGLFPKPLLLQATLEGGERRSSSSSSEGGGGAGHDRLRARSSSNGLLLLQPLDALAWFTFLGRFVAQAVLDERLLNLPFSRPFLRAVRGEQLAPGDGVSVETSLGFVSEFDPAIGASLRFLHDVVRQSELPGADVDALRAEVENMCLSFTLVGDSAIALCDGGAERDVTLANLREYVRLNLVFLLDTTVARQVAAFQRGFEQICGSRPHQKHFLRVFSVRELEQMLGDRGGDNDSGSMWDRAGHELREHTVCDHGYTAESRAIADLIAVLCELPVADQRLFVRFVTGANRLPVGGLAKLEPKLTVVRKLAESDDSSGGGDLVAGRGGNSNSSGFSGADAVLPSASTCTNYLKLPEYSTREVLKARLLFCIREGQGSFHLS